ncbi:MAG TPA: aldo/keto reductase, partial [Planctomycetota bacterium]|nr:aldo/keto reductase [Planctomycetota bacterium]
WGTSEWSADHLSEAAGVARALGVPGPTMDQPQYNMFVRDKVEREFSRLYETIGLGTTIWSPLASGILTGKYANGVPAGSRMALPEYAFLRERLESEEGRAQVTKAAALQGLASEVGTTLPKLAIAWCLKNPNVSTVILGASKVAQLDETLGAIEVTPLLSADVMERIETILDNKPAALPRY